MPTTALPGPVDGPTDETVRAVYGAAMLVRLAEMAGTAHPAADDFEPTGAISYAVTCILQFAHFCQARGQVVAPLHMMAEVAADAALGRPRPPQDQGATPKRYGHTAENDLIDAVHALVRHVAADDLVMAATRAGREPASAAEASVAVLTRWLEEPDYMRDYRAHRPPPNTYAAELYREWAQLDADDAEEARAWRDDNPYDDCEDRAEWDHETYETDQEPGHADR